MYYKLKYLFKNKLKILKNRFFSLDIVQNNSDKWIHISYLTEPFRRKNELSYMNAHQNRREALIISEILNEFNISYRITDFNNYQKKDTRKYDFIFGIEPGFEKYSKKNNTAVKIYYATGAFYLHQNKVITKRTNYFRNKWDINYPYYRLVKKHDSCEIADYIIQIGSKYTLETYPSHLRNKIILIKQSVLETYDFNIGEKINNSKVNNYLWLGGGGSILKGLDLVVDFFLENEELTLHIVGNIDFELLNVYKTKFMNSKNIFIYGFLDVSSKLFYDIVEKCCFFIYPSASEGGSPGSVLILQKYGLIPIVSKYASVNEIDILGFQMQTIDYNGVRNGVEWSTSINLDEIRSLMNKNHNYINMNYSLEIFKNEFTLALRKILINHGFSFS